jgi:hypothetical protein
MFNTSIYMEVLNIYVVGALFMEEREKWDSGGCSLAEFCTAADLCGTGFTIVGRICCCVFMVKGFSVLMVEVPGSSKTWVPVYQTTLHFPEGCAANVHCCKNLHSHIMNWLDHVEQTRSKGAS